MCSVKLITNIFILVFFLSYTVLVYSKDSNTLGVGLAYGWIKPELEKIFPRCNLPESCTSSNDTTAEGPLLVFCNPLSDRLEPTVDHALDGIRGNASQLNRAVSLLVF